MKYAIVGSHGVGKSTLLEDIETTIPKLKEIARVLIAEFGKNPQDMDEKEILDFQWRIHKLQKKRENGDQSFISDRSTYDNLAYLKQVSKERFQKLFDIEKEEKSVYDKVFYVPIEFALEEDGVRYEDNEFQKQIDNTVRDILEELNIDYETISGTREERKQKIESFINNQ